MEMRIGFEVRSSELETGLLSSDNLVELEENCRFGALILKTFFFENKYQSLSCARGRVHFR